MDILKKIKQIFILIFLFGVLFFIPSGCSKASYATTANQFFDALINRNYEKMQGLFTPMANSQIKLEELTAEYTKVYDMLKVTDIQVKQGEVLKEKTRWVYNYDLILNSSAYGELHYDSTLEVVQKADFYLVEWTPANIVAPMSWNDTLHSRILKAKRGEIFDCNGRAVMKNGYAITVYADLTKTDLIEDTAARVSQALSLNSTETAAALTKAKVNGYDTAVVAVYLPGELSLEQEEACLAIPGIKVNRDSITPMRYAPYGSVAAHVIGYSTPVTDEDKKDEKYAALSSGTRVGRTGVEKSRDDILRGTDGFEIYLLSDDAATKKSLYRMPAQDGKDIVLTIDILLQQKAEQIMDEKYKPSSSKGSIIINEPTTGAIKVLASYPTFDLNLYAMDKPKKEASELLDKSKNQPLLNRATQGRYPPGSIYKTMVAIMGLESDMVTTRTEFPYQNDIERVSNTTDGWRPKGSNWSHKIIRQHFVNAEGKPLNMRTGLVWSDNIYFGWLGMEIGKETFLSWSERFGFTSSFSFELPVMASSVTNDEEHLDNLKMLADSCFGQGEVVVTPLQLATAFSLFGNEGSIMSPYIVQSINTTDELGKSVVLEETDRVVLKENLASKENVHALVDILEQTVSEGTGKSGSVKGMTIAGKTGTAQTGNDVNEIGWYAGYITGGGPSYSVLVHLDGPKDNTGPIKFATVKAVFSMLKYDSEED